MIRPILVAAAAGLGAIATLRRRRAGLHGWLVCECIAES